MCNVCKMLMAFFTIEMKEVGIVEDFSYFSYGNKLFGEVRD